MATEICVNVDFKGFAPGHLGVSKSIDRLSGTATCALVRVDGEAQLGAPARVVWRIDDMRIAGQAGSSLDKPLRQRLEQWFISHYGNHVAEKLYHVRNTQKGDADG